MRKLLISLLFVAAFGGNAFANWTGKDATPATITFYNPGACTSVVCTPVFQLTDGTNQATLTTAGADAVSNTLTGLPVYSRGLVFNGTTWDRWTGAITAASLPLPTGAATSALQTTGNTSAATTATQTTASAAAAGTTTDTPCTAPATATACTMEALLKALLNVGQYPSGATAITASATGTAAATTATLAGTTGKTTYICGYSIRANATAAATVTNTITGVITATLSSIMWIAPLASGIGVDEQIFNPCIPASATNTGIAVVSGAPGSGGTVSSKAWGYQL